ncbi:MAG: hypothetical protein Unbinned175contig1000_10 [Prokaryotic dsDNA virus sp.]|nr:MAG: hypothetical protein Unbinned175contig1000_10 [Prokaryotic dsDNA virus sp.]
MAEKSIKYKILIDDAQSASTLAELEQSAEQLNEELKQLDPRSEDFKQLAKSAQQVTNEIDEINTSIEGLKFEDKLMAMDGAAKVLGGSVATVVGSFGLLGVESEKLQFLEQQAANAISFAIGIKDLSEGVSQLAIAFKKSGIAAKLFGNVTRVALLATGIGVFAVALGGIVAYWDDITKGAKKFANAVPFVGKAIDTIKGAFDSLFEAARPVLEFLGLLPDEAERAAMVIVETTSENISQLQRELAIAQAAGESAKELYELRKQLLEEELENLRAAGAEKADIFNKETELLALNAAEQKRIRDEAAENPAQVREKITALNTIKIEGLQELKTAEIETLDAAAISQQIIDKRLLAEREAFVAQSLENQQKLDAARQTSLDNVIALAGAESKVGRAALIAKQILIAKELIMEAKKTITFATLKASESTVAGAAGAAKTAAIGFPQNIPLLIAYGVQIAGIIAAVVSAVRGAKKAAGGAGGSVDIPAAPNLGGGRGAPSTASVQNADAIQEIDAQPCVEAYIVQGDVRNAAEAEAKIRNRRVVAGG